MDYNITVREEVLQSVSGLSEEKLNKVVVNGHWTIMQVLDHLYLMEQSVVHVISNQLANGITETTSEKPIQYTINRSTKFDAPTFVIPSNDFISLDKMKSKLVASREALINVVNSTDQLLLKQRTYPHPAFGELSLHQWIPFVGLHEKRHLAQIEELKAKL